VNGTSRQQQEPTEATPSRLDAALERRRNPRPFRSLSGERQREGGVEVKVVTTFCATLGLREPPAFSDALALSSSVFSMEKIRGVGTLMFRVADGLGLCLLH
jgi:hypothetical protein